MQIKILLFAAMGLRLLKDTDRVTRLGIWKIEETEAWFRSQLKLDEEDQRIIDSIRNEKRKTHWLSSRLLLRRLLNNPEDPIHLSNDKNGMPVILNHDVKISISHSADFSALMLSHKSAVGIDIEKVDPKIIRIHQKFLGADEMLQLSTPLNLEVLYVYWCAKEAMYKLHGRKQLDFRNHLFVDAFRYIGDSGKLTGRIEKDDFQCHAEIQYEKVDDYMMAYISHSVIS